MDFSFTPEDEAFRAELRAWLDEHLPAFRDQGEIGDGTSTGLLRTMERRRAWQRQLNTGNWAAINWPKAPPMAAGCVRTDRGCLVAGDRLLRMSPGHSPGGDGAAGED